MACTIGILAGITALHVVAFLAVVLLLFGGRKLPELARGLARGLRIFRDELHGAQRDVEETLENPPPANPAKQDQTPPGEERKP